MSILIKGLKMPKETAILVAIGDGIASVKVGDGKADYYDAIEIPPHGRLKDADALRKQMYHEAFETDSDLQKWDGGCWIRYRMFENTLESAPTIIEAEACE